MGRATESKQEQLLYLKNRLHLISEMANSLDEEATSKDLENLNQQIESLKIKLNRFKEDWEKADVSHPGVPTNR